MSYHKKKLLILLTVAISVGIVNRFFDDSNFSDGLSSVSWIYWFGMAIVVYLAYYVLTLNCPNPECKKPQIYRSVSPKDWHWPDDSCYACGTKLTEKNNIN